MKKNDALLRIEHLSKLAMTKEQYSDKSSAHYLREMRTTETVRKKHRWIKLVEKKLEKTSTTFVTTKTNDGSTIELTDKESLENAIIKENTKKYHQTESLCPLFHPSFTTR